MTVTSRTACDFFRSGNQRESFSAYRASFSLVIVFLVDYLNCDFWHFASHLATFFVDAWFQKWSPTLANRAGRIARCRNVNRLLQLDRANLNVALSSSANASEIVNQWFSGSADFSPEFGACVQKGICRYFSTVRDWWSCAVKSFSS